MGSVGEEAALENLKPQRAWDLTVLYSDRKDILLQLAPIPGPEDKLLTQDFGGTLEPQDCCVSRCKHRHTGLLR